jgi:hypothetical protein
VRVQPSKSDPSSSEYNDRCLVGRDQEGNDTSAGAPLGIIPVNGRIVLIIGDEVPIELRFERFELESTFELLN